MKKFRRAAALLTLLSLCAAQGTRAEEEKIILPEPAPVEQRIILGESSSENRHEVTLYFVGENSSNLTSSTRSISVEKDETIVESTLSYLLRNYFYDGSQGSLGADSQLIDVEVGCGVATVNLEIGGSAQLSDQTELTRCMAIANTLLSLEGVDAVNILTGGRSGAICSIPLGVFTRQNESISAAYAQLQSERDSFLVDKSAGISRDALIYYPSANGYFLSEKRTLRFDSDDYSAAILAALRENPAALPQCSAPIPASEDILLADPIVYVNSAGERILDLKFSAMLPNYLAFSGMPAWQFYGSIVLSMCSFVPELDGVYASIDGVPVNECAMGERVLRFADGVMRRNDFSSRIGSSAVMYFANAEGGITRTEYPVSQATAVSTRGVLAAMVSAAAPEGLVSVFPTEIYGEDILGVSLDNGVATVNLSGSFYTRCQSLTARQERNLIYAMVNTLCELPGIGAVGFRIEGDALESLSQNIYLKTNLLPDPGMG